MSRSCAGSWVKIVEQTSCLGGLMQQSANTAPGQVLADPCDLDRPSSITLALLILPKATLLFCYFSFQLCA